jgi:hypothetical protein
MIITNPYKRRDVFRCSQEAHGGFDGRVSAFHVLKEKNCHPQGCIYFVWHCVLMQKGRACIHKYSSPGRKCGGCTYFAEEKIHLQPRLLLPEDAFRGFLEEAERFDEWMRGVRYRRLSVAGRIHTVKPWVEQRILDRQTRTSLRGYLLVFRRGFIGLDEYRDSFYVRISERLMSRHGFIPRMRVELTGEIREDRGRVVVHHPGQVEILSKGWGFPWTWDRALVAVRTASLLSGQPDSCLECPWGVLVDVTDESGGEAEKFRRLFCLKGLQDPDGCYVKVLAGVRKEPRKPAAGTG